MSNGPGHASPWINRGAGRSGWDYFFVPSPKAAAAKGKFESPRNQLWCQIVMTSASSPIFFPFARTCEFPVTGPQPLSSLRFWLFVSRLFISLTDPGGWGLRSPSPRMETRWKRAQRVAFAYRLQPNRWHVSLMTKSLLRVQGRGPASITAQYLVFHPLTAPPPPVSITSEAITLSASSHKLCCLHT